MYFLNKKYGHHGSTGERTYEDRIYFHQPRAGRYCLHASQANAKAAISAEKLEVIEQVEALETQISDISRELWNFSEIALRETQSDEFLASVLEGAGFSVKRGMRRFKSTDQAQRFLAVHSAVSKLFNLG